MRIGAPTETIDGEARVALTPDSARQLQKLGHECLVQAGAGRAAGFEDADYRKAGVRVVDDAAALYANSDVVIKVRPPLAAELAQFGRGQVLVSFFHPAQQPALLELARSRGVDVIAMDMVPRISRAQKLDALSSMANLTGYRAVIEAAANFGRFFTGQITAAGRIPPARVLVIGAGVAGLAAIGTSVSLGAQTFAFDVRPEVAEQISSMGAEFVFLSFEGSQQDGAATGGYAAPSSPEFRERQLEKFRELAPQMDIVITTALIPGRDAPRLWLADMVAAMKPGSVIVDLAAERGGNCELTVPGERITTPNGVIIVGYTDFPSRMAAQASTLYATNVRHLVADLTPGKDGRIVHDMQDDVIRGATAVFGGEITFPPPPPRIQAIAARPAAARAPEPTPQERRAQEAAAFRRSTRQQVGAIASGALLLAAAGAWAPAAFMPHFTVFVLACFVGFQVIWNVSHALHTPLMAVTNAISGIIVLGALLQLDTGQPLVTALAGLAVAIATINIVGGFMVTRRMLGMFRKS